MQKKLKNAFIACFIGLGASLSASIYNPDFWPLIIAFLVPTLIIGTKINLI